MFITSSPDYSPCSQYAGIVRMCKTDPVKNEQYHEKKHFPVSQKSDLKSDLVQQNQALISSAIITEQLICEIFFAIQVVFMM